MLRISTARGPFIDEILREVNQPKATWFAIQGPRRARTVLEQEVCLVKRLREGVDLTADQSASAHPKLLGCRRCCGFV